MRYLVSLLILAPLAHADICADMTSDLTEDMEVPELFPYKNERIDGYVNGSFAAHATIEDGHVRNFSCSPSNATLKVMVEDNETVHDILSSDSKIDEIDDKMSNDEIELEAIKTRTKIKNLFLRISVKVASWFT